MSWSVLGQLAGQPSVRTWRTLLCCNFFRHCDMINVKLCMMVVLAELYPLILLRWPWLYFKVTAVSNSFNWKFCVLIRLSWNFVRFLIMSSRSWIYHYFKFFFSTCSREIKDIFPCFKKLQIVFFSGTVKTRSFKLCMIITFFGVNIFIAILMTLTSFQGHRCVRNINCKLYFLDCLL